MPNKSTAETALNSSPMDYLRLCRPKQWAKNLLVAAAPFAAGVMNDLATIAQVGLGIAAFSAISSGMYAINDSLDAEADRGHPKKRHRPVAAGRITPLGARVFGVSMIAAGLAIGIATGSMWFVGILVIYALMITAYSLWLKHVALVDIAVIAFGFLLRALSGAALVDVPISNAFLIVTTFGALFMAAGKRYSERFELDDTALTHRAALDDYAPGFIEFLLGVSAAVVLLSYFLWAQEVGQNVAGAPWAIISLGPFVMAILRYAQLIYLGRGGEPETLVMGDRGMQAAGAIWVVTLTLAFYGGSG